MTDRKYQPSCVECGPLGDESMFGKAISDAEWHNTNTGHDVSVDGDRGGWDLTNSGWEPYEPAAL